MKVLETYGDVSLAGDGAHLESHGEMVALVPALNCS